MTLPSTLLPLLFYVCSRIGLPLYEVVIYPPIGYFYLFLAPTMTTTGEISWDIPSIASTPTFLTDDNAVAATCFVARDDKDPFFFLSLVDVDNSRKSQDDDNERHGASTSAAVVEGSPRFIFDDWRVVTGHDSWGGGRWRFRLFVACDFMSIDKDDGDDKEEEEDTRCEEE